MKTCDLLSSDSLVIKHALDAAKSADGDILVPQVLLGKVHDVLGGDGTNNSLDLGWGHAAAGGDELSANVLGDGGSAVKGEEEGGFELGLGALDFGFADVGGEAGPFLQT